MSEASIETNPVVEQVASVEQAAPVAPAEQAAIKAALEILDTPGAEDNIKINQAVAVLRGS